MAGTTRSPSWLWPALMCWTVLMAVLDTRHLGTSWHFFDEGARLLRSDGAVHLYAQHPELQIGPVALLVAAPFAALGPEVGRGLACAAMAATGPVLLRAISRLRPDVDARTLGLAGFPFLLVWTQLAVGAGHLDDVLALCLAVAALHQVTARPVLAAALLGLAADAKPWAVAFVVLLLAVPRARIGPALLVWAAVVLVAWLPFVLGDHGTLSALSHFSIANSSSSTLRFFEVDTARTPTWDRSAQLALGLLLGAAVVRTRGPAAVLVVVMASRLVLEPGTHIYYCGGLLAATAVHDLAVSRRVLPVATLGAFCFYYVPQWLRSVHALDDASSTSRALACVLLVALVLATGPRCAEASGARGARARRAARTSRP